MSPDLNPVRPSEEAGHSIRALVAGGAAAGLLPFAPRHAGATSSTLSLGHAAAIAVATSAGATAARTVKDVRAHSGGDGRSSKLPTGPPGNAGAGAIAGASGGAAAAVWCAILLCCLLSLAQALRRHRYQLSLPAPSGVVLLLHRPG
jgi:hypothetical protein